MAINKRFSIDVPDDIHYEFKKVALNHNTTMKDLMIRLMISFIHQQKMVENEPSINNDDISMEQPSR